MSEDIVANYTQGFSLGCDVAGVVILAGGDDTTCTVTNTFVPPPVVSSGGGGSSTLTIDICPNTDYSSSYYDGSCGTAPVVTSVTIVSTGTVAVVTPAAVISTGVVTVPRPIVVYEVRPTEIFPIIDTTLDAPIIQRAPVFPSAGLPSADQSIPFWALIMSVMLLLFTPIGLTLLNKKYTK